MNNVIRLTFSLIGLLGPTLIALPSQAAFDGVARSRPATAPIIVAEVKKKATAPRTTPRTTPSMSGPKAAPRMGTPKTTVRTTTKMGTPKTTTKMGTPKSTMGGPRIGSPKKATTKKAGPATKTGTKKVGPATKTGTKKVGPATKTGTKKAGPDTKGPTTKTGTKKGGPTVKGPVTKGPKTITKGPGKTKTGIKKGPGSKTITKTKAPPKINVTVVNRRNVTIFRGGRTLFIGNRITRIVSVATLAAIAVGTVSYYPYAYAVIAQPVCRGVTEEGCALRWQNVPTDDGDVVAQCVQYCPRNYAPPPVQAAPVGAAVVPGPGPVAEGGSCALTIYSEPNFAGISADIEDEQPLLSEVGWAGEIASVRIGSGTWDFYSEEQYGGDTIRLGPGEYASLPPAWNGRISSLMCSEP
jgi:hypothetical protein